MLIKPVQQLTTVNNLAQTKCPQHQFNMSRKTTDRPTQCTSRMCLHNVYHDSPTPTRMTS